MDQNGKDAIHINVSPTLINTASTTLSTPL